MTDKLPPQLLALFTPRPSVRYLPPQDHGPEDRRTPKIGGVGAYLKALNEYKATDEYNPTESWLQRRDRVNQEKKTQAENQLKKQLAAYKPVDEAKKRGFGDAFKTLFVSRLSYNTEPKDLEREFSKYGPIERIRIVSDNSGDSSSRSKKNRGYAFVVFDREQDMKAAYKETDGIRIRDRRISVDVERGRTVKEWQPRRLGGGLGGRGEAKGLPPRPGGPGGFPAPTGPGGFRGGFNGPRGPRNGGFRGGFAGGFGGGRSNGFGSAPPDGAPSGPRGPRREGGFGGQGRFEDRNGGGGRFEDRPRGSGSNQEPVAPRRERGSGGYRDTDRGDRDRDHERGDREGGYGRDDHRKRSHEGNQYDDSGRSKRRY